MGDRLLLTAASPTSLDQYLSSGGGHGLRRLREIGPERLLDELDWAGLRGRGGAGFPTARKWRTVRDSAGPTRALVCNAAEGEPGTYKDRWLLRTNPWLVLEGIAVAALTIGAERTVIATKAAFTLELASLQAAHAEMIAHDLLGGVDIEVVRGPDRYLFGEEKAMLEVIEGREPLPRLLPPYQVGLGAMHGSPSPTVVNNVETLAHAGLIARDGGARFRHMGTPDSPGTMLFTISGDVARPGVYEYALGSTLASIVDRAEPTRTVKVVFPGASSGVIPGDGLDVAVDFDVMRAAGTGLGSGGFVVHDDRACIVAATAAATRFLADESCAQCPACKQGAITITAALDEIEAGRGTDEHLDVLRSRARSVTGGKRCGLPTGTAAITTSVLEHFSDEIEAHLGTTCSGTAPAVGRLVASAEHRGAFTPARHEAWRTPRDEAATLGH